MKQVYNCNYIQTTQMASKILGHKISTKLELPTITKF